VEEAAAEASKAIEPPELPRRILRYSEAYRRSVPYTFLEASRSSGGEIKSHFPEVEEMANYRERYLTDSPHWLKLQHRAP